MIRAFKRSQIASALVMLLSVFIAVVIWFRDTGYPFFVPLIGSVLMILIGYFSSRILGNIISSTENTRLLGYLHIELDPQKFIEAYRDIPAKIKTDSKTSAICRSYLADGYAADGDFETALKTLELVGAPDDIAIRGLYASNRCAYYLGIEDTKKAADAILQLQRIIDSCKSDKPELAKNLTESNNLYRQNLNCLTKGSVDKEWLESVFNRAQYNLLRLNIKKILAMAALRKGNASEAEKHLSYLRENSGKTYYKLWADEHSQ